MSRLLPDSAYESLKTATAAALAVATPSGSTQAFSALTRVTPRQLRKYADHFDPTFAALDVVADLEHAAGAPLIARALAQLSGCTLAPLTAQPHVRLLNAIKETSEAAAVAAELALTDYPGGLGLDQAKAARAEIREAIAALAGLDAQLSARIEGSSACQSL